MNFYLILPIVQASLSFVLLIVILRSRSQDKARYLFALYLTGLLLWGVLIFFMRSSPDLDRAHFWEKLLIPLALLSPVFIYHFSIIFGGYHINKWIIPLSYIVCALVFIFSYSGWVVLDMQMKSYGFAPEPGPLFLPVILMSNGFVIAALVNLWRYSRNALFKEERNRSVYIFIGLLASLLGGAFDVLPLLGLPLYPGLIICNIFFCLISSVAILKYNLLGVQIIIRKGVSYFVASAVAAIPYLLVLVFFERVIRSTVQTWVWVVLLMLLAFILQPIWRATQSLVDRLFNISRYDLLKELDDFSQNTHRLNDITILGNSLVKMVERALQASNVYLFLPSKENEFNLVATSKESLSKKNFFSHSPILTWLGIHKVLLRREEIAYISRFQSLTTAEKDEIKALDAELYVPVIDKESVLAGIIVLGQKLTRRPYSDVDEQLILNVTHRLALELENARLYTQEVAARKELQKQMEMKTEFLHSVAHELKTPLTAILSSSEMLIDKISLKGGDLEQQLSRNVHNSAQIMNRRVSELLEFARVQIGSLEINRQLVDINQIAQEVVSQLSPLFLNRKQHLNLEAGQVPAVKADKDKMEQVFANLLSNANKYSPNNSDIKIRTRQNNGSVLVEVEDSAPVISGEEKSRLFTAYYRGENSNIRKKTPGLGLGLAITKKIVEMHGGTIWVESNPGKGNIFAFSIKI